MVEDKDLPQDRDLGGTVVVDIDTTELERGLRQRIESWQRVTGYAAKEIGRGVKLDFQRTTRTWSKRPKFETVTETSADGFTVLVGTDNPIYSFVDRGTRQHFIEPRNPGGVLVFQWGGPGSYAAKTEPGFIGSQDGGPSGAIVKRQRVHHPGTLPRDFSKLIRWKWQGEAPAVLRKYAQNWANAPEQAASQAPTDLSSE